MFNAPASIIRRYASNLLRVAYLAGSDASPLWARYDAACEARKVASRTGRMPRGYGWLRAQDAAEQRDHRRIEAKACGRSVYGTVAA